MTSLQLTSWPSWVNPFVSTPLGFSPSIHPLGFPPFLSICGLRPMCLWCTLPGCHVALWSLLCPLCLHSPPVSMPSLCSCVAFFPCGNCVCSLSHVNCVRTSPLNPCDRIYAAVSHMFTCFSVQVSSCPQGTEAASLDIAKATGTPLSSLNTRNTSAYSAKALCMLNMSQSRARPLLVASKATLQTLPLLS